MKRDIHTPGELVAYLTDCTLATVAHMRMLKSASKSELTRQISIAQTAITYGRLCGVPFRGTRAEDVIKDYKGHVADWAAKYNP